MLDVLIRKYLKYQNINKITAEGQNYKTKKKKFLFQHIYKHWWCYSGHVKEMHIKLCGDEVPLIKFFCERSFD